MITQLAHQPSIGKNTEKKGKSKIRKEGVEGAIKKTDEEDEKTPAIDQKSGVPGGKKKKGGGCILRAQRCTRTRRLNHIAATCGVAWLHNGGTDGGDLQGLT